MYENEVSHKFIYFKLIISLFPFIVLFRGFFAQKYSEVSSLAFDYLTLLYVVKKLPLCSQCLFVAICSKCCFQKKDNIIIQNHYEEKGGLRIKFRKTIYRKTGLTHPSKRLLKRSKDCGTLNREESSGRPRSVTTEVNTDLIEELICSQEEALHKHVAPCKIAEQTEISRSSIRRMTKRRNFSQYKRVKTPKISFECRNRRYAHAIALAQKFERNTCII